MSIQHAILGLLSWRPATGYDLKKVIEASSSMYWSGNNNQIYKSLVQLQSDGLVTNETVHREGALSRKVYSVTDKGHAELMEWLRSTPEVPEFRKPFLVQLAWADRLEDRELSELLEAYETELKMRLLLQEERMRRGVDAPGRTARETLLWDLIEENIASSYRNEIAWVQKARERLFAQNSVVETAEETHGLDYQVGEAGGERYVEVRSAVTPVATEQDTMDLVALCWSQGAHRLMIHAAALSEDFFDLSTGVAGKILQKFVNYTIQAAVVLPAGKSGTVKFSEMVSEANRGRHFRVFTDRTEAEGWLVGKR